jgi:hypothetical protein
MKHPNKRYKASTDIIVYEWMVLQNGPSSKETSFHDALHINKDPVFFWATVPGKSRSLKCGWSFNGHSRKYRQKNDTESAGWRAVI